VLAKTRKGVTQLGIGVAGRSRSLLLEKNAACSAESLGDFQRDVD
jgi:hypothetical protein